MAAANQSNPESDVNREQLARDLAAIVESKCETDDHALASLDDAVLNRAAAHFVGEFAGVRSGVKRRVLLRRVVPLAAAACLLIAGSIAIRAMLVTNRGSSTPALAGDVNGDDVVDVIDAFHLARAIEDGDLLDDSFDLSRDAQVTSDDVDLLLIRIVSLDSRGAGG